LQVTWAGGLMFKSCWAGGLKARKKNSGDGAVLGAWTPIKKNGSDVKVRKAWNKRSANEDGADPVIQKLDSDNGNGLNRGLMAAKQRKMQLRVHRIAIDGIVEKNSQIRR